MCECNSKTKLKKSRKGTSHTLKKSNGKIKGGVQHISSTSSCKDCLKELLNKNNWHNIKIIEDGNCFFRSIAKHCEFENIKIDGKEVIFSDLRNKCIDYLQGLIDIEWELPEDYRSIIPNIKFNTYSDEDKKIEITDKDKKIEINKRLNNLKEEGVYQTDEFDMIIQYAADAINMTLNIYSIDENNENIRLTSYVPEHPITEINLLYLNIDHYELLYPDNVTIIYERQNKSGMREINMDDYNRRWDTYSEARIKEHKNNREHKQTQKSTKPTKPTKQTQKKKSPTKSPNNKTHNKQKNNTQKNISRLMDQYFEEKSKNSNNATLASIYNKLEKRGATSNQLQMLL